MRHERGSTHERLHTIDRVDTGRELNIEKEKGGEGWRTMLWLADEKNVEGRFAVTRRQDVVDSYVK